MTQKQVIVSLLEQGKTVDEIQQTTNFKRLTIQYYRRQWREGLITEDSKEKTDSIEMEDTEIDYLKVRVWDDFDEEEYQEKKREAELEGRTIPEPEKRKHPFILIEKPEIKSLIREKQEL